MVAETVRQREHVKDTMEPLANHPEHTLDVLEDEEVELRILRVEGGIVEDFAHPPCDIWVVLGPALIKNGSDVNGREHLRTVPNKDHLPVLIFLHKNVEDLLVRPLGFTMSKDATQPIAETYHSTSRMSIA